jgi:hypothetical protein
MCRELLLNMARKSSRPLQPLNFFCNLPERDIREDNLTLDHLGCISDQERFSEFRRHKGRQQQSKWIFFPPICLFPSGFKLPREFSTFKRIPHLNCFLGRVSTFLNRTNLLHYRLNGKLFAFPVIFRERHDLTQLRFQRPRLRLSLKSQAL